MWIPESPRWLMIHGHPEQANAIVDDIERSATGQVQDPRGHAWPLIKLRMRDHTPLREVAHTLFSLYRQRSLVGLALMIAQAFFYNAIFFSYALVLTRFYEVPAASIGWYMLPFALGNFVGPLVLGPLFDSVGRKPMIAATYAISGVLLLGAGMLFRENLVGATMLTVCWTGIFFFASAAASSAYLTVSESFPLEARALAIAFFYALGTAAGGVMAPLLFAWLIGTGERGNVFLGYLLGAGLMIGAAIVELAIGVKAERQSLESIARPLSSVVS
jgi:MFS family permease